MSTSLPSQSGTDRFYRQICEHLGMALIATDVNLNIVMWNAAAARTFGATAETMIGTPIARIIPQERRRMAENTLKRAIDTGETILIEFEHRDKKGGRRELAGTIAPVVLDNGTRVGASICIRDITRRMTLQGDLYEARKMAALGEMAGAIAHYFNNILGGVITGLDFAQSSNDPELRERVLGQVSKGLGRATTLLTGLLAFAEGDRRSEDLCDLTELINQLADVVEQAVVSRGIAFRLHMPPLPVVAVHRFPVRTALQNIVDNAVEAMPEGGTLSIDVSTAPSRGSRSVHHARRKGPDQGEIIVLIADTGKGLDEAAKARIFEPFWSTKTDDVVTGSGLGLGLAVAHGLIQMVGGTITVTSETGKGSCFRITFPPARNST